MVIQASNSCSTLVSLEDHKRHSSEYDDETRKQPFESYQRTNLLLPADLFDDDSDDDCYLENQSIYLPVTGDVDRYLRGVPQVMETADELLANRPKLLDASCGQRILSVGQGEVAHCTPEQADILVSDKATTCHIIIFKSTSSDGSTLASCTHLDSAEYESCVRGIMSEHLTHHDKSLHCGEDEKKEDCANSDKISMDIHILGGFEDDDSRIISNWLLRLLANIAKEYENEISMRLQTCAISSINDNGHGCPIGRGLALNIRTGVVFLAKVDGNVAGPLPVLRAVRLWSGSERLALIHSSRSAYAVISAFEYKPIADLDILLRLSDSILLQYTSTSPHVEEPDFCGAVRSTLTFMNTNQCETIFPSSKSLYFTRIGRTNQWRPVV